MTRHAPTTATPGWVLLNLAFGCSGTAALIYETTWTRLLALHMGHTVAAVSTVLAAFMGGLAVGAAVSGRVAPRLGTGGALRAYAALEVLIALLALAVPMEIMSVQTVLSAAYADGTANATFAALRVTIALVVVAVPAAAMGATLPLVIRAQVESPIRAARDTAWLYAVNAFGATAGAVASGFVLLPAFGMRGAMFTGVALNVLSAAIGFRLAGRWRSRPAETIAAAAAPTPATDTRGRDAVRARTIAAAALAISGCASLLLQVAWTRILALVLGPTTYAFSAMVAVFIAGISAGALVGGMLGRRGPAPGWLTVTLFVSGAAGVVAAAWVPQVPLVIAGASASADATFGGMVRLQALVIGALMLPMTVAFGASFPLAVGLAVSERRRIAADVATIYAANTLGAIAGALAGGFVVIGWFGLQGAVYIAALMTAGGAALVGLAYGTGRRRWTIAGATAATLAAIWFMPRWDPALISSGAYKYSAYLPAENRAALLRAGTILYYREGAASTVSVRRLAGAVSLAIDGKIDASTGGDMLTQRLLAHVPLLLHPDPRRVLIIGLGSGVTLGSALRHPIERAETVEISREVVDASSFFTTENGGALADPRARLIIGDGRSHVMLGRTTYDVVISEPSNPWMAGIAALFTQEMFDGVRRRLAPGGVFCQWAHAYDMSESDLRSIIATFTASFPNASLWSIGENDVLLVGTSEPVESALARVGTAWFRPGVAADLAGVGVTSPGILLSLFTAASTTLASRAAGAELQRDDRQALEFSGPRNLYGPSAAGGAAFLRSLASTQDVPPIVAEARTAPAYRRDRGLMLLRAEAFDAAAEDLLAALDRDPTQPDAVDGLLQAGTAARRLDDVERILRAIVRRDPDSRDAAVALSRLLAARGEYGPATAVLGPLLKAASPIRALEQMASVLMDAGNSLELASIVGRMRASHPDADATLYFAGALALQEGRPHDAARLGEALRDRGLARAREHTLLGTAYATLGRREDARRAFEAARAADPRDVIAYENLGALALEEGDARAAAAHYAEALVLDPLSPAARRGLAEALGRGK